MKLNGHRRTALDTRRKKWLAAGLLLLVFAAVKLAALYWWSRSQETGGAPQTVVCDVVAGCRLPDGSLLTFTPPGRKTPFDVHLKTAAARASLSFTMQDMEMGFNRYDLQPQSDGLGARAVRLPYCTADRSDFIAELTLDGQRYRIPFTAR
ncbi:hypothetical protein [Neisseria leonii]|uniref:hypothetical protein n=1 Tax=Neisseria leonii TaxID=2995413 RepID=UPI0030D5C821